MTKSVLDRPVLFLNKHWAAIHVDTAREAMKAGCVGAASFLDHNDYILYTMDEWMELPTDDWKAVRTPRTEIRIPEVMVLTNFSSLLNFEVKLTTRNLLIRDGWTCQYTGQRLPNSALDIDHVIPRSHGGRHDWTNVVISDRLVNKKKADRTPREAGLKLVRPPFKPKWSPLFTKTVRNVPASWERFLSKEDRKRYVYRSHDPKNFHDTIEMDAEAVIG